MKIKIPLESFNNFVELYLSEAIPYIKTGKSSKKGWNSILKLDLLWTDYEKGRVNFPHDLIQLFENLEDKTGIIHKNLKEIRSIVQQIYKKKKENVTRYGKIMDESVPHIKDKKKNKVT